MAKNTNAWQVGCSNLLASASEMAENRGFFHLARTLQKIERSRPTGWPSKTQDHEDHAMFTAFEAKKTFSAILCTVLFSATCVLSAVGPANAVEVSNPSVVSHPLA